MRGRVKKFFGDGRGFGFIVPDDGGTPDAFFHESQLKAAGITTAPEIGQLLEFDVSMDRAGRMRARNIKIVHDAETERRKQVDAAWASRATAKG
jgi:CspA family cold shock protein